MTQFFTSLPLETFNHILLTPLTDEDALNVCLTSKHGLEVLQHGTTQLFWQTVWLDCPAGEKASFVNYRDATRRYISLTAHLFGTDPSNEEIHTGNIFTTRRLFETRVQKKSCHDATQRLNAVLSSTILNKWPHELIRLFSIGCIPDATTMDQLLTQKLSKSVLQQALLQRGALLEALPEPMNDDPELVLAAISSDPFAIRFASNRLKNDPLIAEKALETSIFPYQYLGEELRRDATLALRVVLRSASMLAYAHHDLQDDEVVVNAAVQRDGTALQFASSRLQDCPSIVFRAVEQNGSALYFAHEQWKHDEQIARAAIMSNPAAFRYIGQELRAKKEIAKIALQRDPDLYSVLPKKLQNDPEILQLIS